MTYHLYLLKCADNSLYSGITTSLTRRLHEHNHTKKGAKYTRGKRPVSLVYSKEYPDRSSASIAEHQLRTLSHQQKLDIIAKELINN
jgi:putative endonuclease